MHSKKCAAAQLMQISTHCNLITKFTLSSSRARVTESQSTCLWLKQGSQIVKKKKQTPRAIFSPKWSETANNVPLPNSQWRTRTRIQSVVSATTTKQWLWLPKLVHTTRWISRRERWNILLKRVFSIQIRISKTLKETREPIEIVYTLISQYSHQ